MRKAIAVFCLILVSAVLFSGCVASIELSERSIVGALGMDYTVGAYKITILSFNTDMAEDAKSVFDVEYIYGEGQSPQEAFDNARHSTSKQLFFGHNTVLVLGRTLAEQAIYETVNYLSQSKEARVNISVFMANKTAKELLLLQTTDKAHISGTIEKLSEEAPNGLDLKVQLFQLMQSLRETGVKGILPIIEAVPIAQGAATENKDVEMYDIFVRKIAVFDQNKLVGEAQGDLMAGIFLLQNRVISIGIAARLPEGEKIYANLAHTHTRLRYEAGESPRISILCTGILSLTGKESVGREYTGDVNTQKEALEREVTYRIEAAYSYVKNKLKIDLFDTRWHVAQRDSMREANRFAADNSMPEAEIRCNFNITG